MNFQKDSPIPHNIYEKKVSVTVRTVLRTIVSKLTARAWAHACQDLSARCRAHAHEPAVPSETRKKNGERKTPLKRETKRKGRAMTHTVTCTRSPTAHTEVT